MQILLFLLGLGFGIWGVLSSNIVGLLVAMFGILLALRGVGSSSTPVIANWLVSATQSPEEAEDASDSGWMWWIAFAIFGGVVAAGLASQLPNSAISGYVWLLSIALLIWAGFRHDGIALTPKLLVQRIHSASQQQTIVLEWIAVCWITVVAAVLRMYRVSLFPPTMHRDEGFMGLMAHRALENGPADVPLFAAGWFDHPILFHYLQAVSMSLFGVNEVALRLLSALFGALCIPLVYLIGRMAWGRVAGLTAAWLVAVSHFFIHYSRVSLNNIYTVFFALLMILLFTYLYEVRTTSANRGISTTIAIGLVAGVAQYFYFGSRLLFVLIPPLLFYLWIEKRVGIKQTVMLMVGILIAYGPLLTHYYNYPDTFSSRSDTVYALQERYMHHIMGTDASWPDDLSQLLQHQFERNIRFFAGDGDVSPFYLADIPTFDIAMMILFWLGLGTVLARFLRYHEFALMVWFWGGLIVAGVLTENPPYGPRLIVFFPAAYLTAGVFIQYLWNLLTGLWPSFGRRVLAPGLAGIAGFMLITNVDTYFFDYASKASNLAPILIAREAATEPELPHAFLMGGPHLRTDNGVIQLLTRNTNLTDLESPEALSAEMLSNAALENQELLVFVLPHRLGELPQIQARFPGGVETSYMDPLNRLIYVTYRATLDSVP